MPEIDWTRTETAATRAAAQAAALRERLRQACRERILAVVDETAQANLSAVVAAGMISEADLATYRTGLAWIGDMRAAYATAATAGEDPVWPDVPAGVAELAARF